MKIVHCALVAAAVLCGCSKPGPAGITGGGKGGSITLNVTPEYSNFLIDTCTVYIKYGTLDAPANNVYDDSATVTLQYNGTKPVAAFTNLTTGLYYIFGMGYHSTGGHPPNVKGGLPVTISNQGVDSVYLTVYPYNP